MPFPEIKDWKTLRIRLARTACCGTCPVYSVEVRGDGKVLFDGQENVPEVERLHGYVSREQVAHLLSLFRHVDYFSLEDKYV